MGCVAHLGLLLREYRREFDKFTAEVQRHQTQVSSIMRIATTPTPTPPLPPSPPSIPPERPPTSNGTRPSPVLHPPRRLIPDGRAGGVSSGPLFHAFPAHFGIIAFPRFSTRIFLHFLQIIFTSIAYSPFCPSLLSSPLSPLPRPSILSRMNFCWLEFRTQRSVSGAPSTENRIISHTNIVFLKNPDCGSRHVVPSPQLQHNLGRIKVAKKLADMLEEKKQRYLNELAEVPPPLPLPYPPSSLHAPAPGEIVTLF